MKQLSKTVLRNSAFGMAAQFAIKALSFLFTLLIVRNLGPEVYGQYTAVLAFGAVFAIFSDLGMSVYTVREVARGRDAPDGHARVAQLYGNVLWLRLVLSVLTAVALVVTAWVTGEPPVIVGAIALSSLGLLLYAVQGSSEAVLSGMERLDLLAGTRVFNQLLFVALGALVLWQGFGYYGLILANLAGVGLMTWLCWRAARGLGLRPARPTPAAWWALIRASLPFGLIGFALGLSYKFDSVLLSYRSQAETGLYNAVYNLIFSAVILSNALNTALYPSLTRQAATHPESLPRIYEHTLRYLLIIALPIAAGAALLAGPLVPFLFGHKYQEAAPALAILIWVVPLMYTSEFLGYVVLIAGQERFVARSVLVSTACNIAANLVLVPIYGYLGAAVMTVVTEAILVSQYLWLLRDLLRRLRWGAILLRPLAATAGMALVVLLLRDLPLAVPIAAGGLTYIGLLFALGVLGRAELRFLRDLRAGAEVSG